MTAAVVIVGMRCAGKTTLARFLEREHSRPRVGAGGIMRGFIEGSTVDGSASRAAAAMYVMRTKGFDAVARHIVDTAESELIIDGLRTPEELAFVRKSFERSFVIEVNAPVAVRVERARDRARPGDLLDDRGFKLEEHLHQAMAAATDYSLWNDASYTNDATLEKLGEKARHLLPEGFFA